MKLKLSTRRSYDVLVVDLEGRLDSTSADYGNDEMVRIAKGDCKQVVINLQQLDFISSAGLRVLLLAAKLLQSAGGQLKFCNANELVKDVLETAGLNSLLFLYPNEAEAVKSF